MCACETNCAGEREAKETEEKSRDEEVERKVCVCLPKLLYPGLKDL